MLYDKSVRRTDGAGAGAGAHSADAGGIRVEGLGKRYGALWALRDVDAVAPAGTVLGLLGHNGAGKTTFLRILTTLTRPTEGQAWVAGHDVAQAPARVRERIGVAGQAATIDGLLTARANLEMIGRLYHLPAAEARRRAGVLLERVDLAGDAERLVSDFSGGMRRRLDLVASLIADPPVIFLDEPTTGLDPHSRNELWALLRERVRGGATLVLTTQYLEEADRLADHIILLDHGRVAARGTPAQLKAGIGGERVVVTVAHADQLAAASAALAPFADGATASDPSTLSSRLVPGRDDGLTTRSAATQVVAPVRAGTRLVEIVRALDAAGIDAHDVHRRDVTLDDVFLAITAGARDAGRAPAPAPAPAQAQP